MFNKLIDFKIVVISRQLLANFIQGLTQKIFVSAESSNLCRVCLREALTFFSVISTSGSIEHAESKRAQSTEKERRIFFRTNIFIIVIKKIRVFV